jgi:hypothetical protein
MRYLDTPRASQHLAKRGVDRSTSYLRKLRCVGGGPVYRTLNGKPYYTEADLDAWIEESLSPPVHNTSEAGAVRLPLAEPSTRLLPSPEGHYQALAPSLGPPLDDRRRAGAGVSASHDKGAQSQPTAPLESNALTPGEKFSSKTASELLAGG